MIEVYDVLHEFLVLVPVCSLQEVGCKDVSLCASCVVGKTDDFCRVSKLDQTLKRRDFVANFDVKVGSHFETALFAAFLGNDSGQVSSFALFDGSLGLFVGYHFLDELFLDRNVLLDANVKCFLVLLGADQQRNCSFKLVSLEQRGNFCIDCCLVASFEELLLIAGLLIKSLVGDELGKSMFFGKQVRLFDSHGFPVKSDSFFDEAFPFEVRS